jgi:hypothetical protein
MWWQCRIIYMGSAWRRFFFFRAVRQRLVQKTVQNDPRGYRENDRVERVIDAVFQ